MEECQVGCVVGAADWSRILCCGDLLMEECQVGCVVRAADWSSRTEQMCRKRLVIMITDFPLNVSH